MNPPHSTPRYIITLLPLLRAGFPFGLITVLFHVQSDGGSDVLPQWLLSLIILASTGTMCLLLFIVGRVMRIYREGQAGVARRVLTGRVVRCDAFVLMAA